MELRSYRYFWTIAVEQNISRAARRLNVTQPTLSRQLKDMEEELGVELFHRGNRKLVLTEAGRYLKDRAEEILALADSTELEFLNRRKELFSGHIAIGSVEVGNSADWAEILEEFVTDYPNVTFSIFSSTGDEILEKLDKGLLDVAILIQPISFEKYNQVLLPNEEPWGLLVEKDNFLAQNDMITPNDIQGVPLLLPRRQESQEMIAKWAEVPVEKLNVRGTYNLIFNVFSLVESSIASAFTIQGVASPFASEKYKFVPLDPPINSQCIFVWKKNKVYSPVVKEFIEYVNYAFKA